jgi:hypothetical protein
MNEEFSLEKYISSVQPIPGFTREGVELTKPPAPDDFLTSMAIKFSAQPMSEFGVSLTEFAKALTRWKVTLVMIAFPTLHLGGWAVWSLLEGNPDLPVRTFNLLTVLVLYWLVWSIRPRYNRPL